METSDWIALSGIAVVIIGALIRHIIADVKHQANLESRMERIERDIGNHESGIRGELHRQVGLISRLRAVLYFVARKLNLDIMKDLDDDK